MEASVEPRSDHAGQFGIVALLLWMTALAVALKLSLVYESPGVLSAAVIALVAWLGCRVGRLNVIATTMAGVGIQCLVVAWLQFRAAHGGLFAEFPTELLSMWGATLLFIAALAYICGLGPHAKVAIPRLPIAAAGICFLLVVLNFTVARPIVNGIRETVIAERSALNAAIPAQVVADIDAVCQKLGRAPEEHELARHLGKPLPALDCGGSEEAVQYTKTGPHSYRLKYCECDFMADTLTFDSAANPRVWVRERF